MAEPVVATRQTIEEIFDGAANLYGRAGPNFFSYFGEKLVELVAPADGARVLDVGTGTGAVLLPAAKCVGPSGQVVGIDVSSNMVRKAEEAVRQAGLTNCQVLKMDAEHLEFEDWSFDAALGGFSLLFISSMEAALQEMRRVLRPGGCVGVSLWSKAPPPFDPAWKIFADQVRKYKVEVRMPQRVAYAPGEVPAILAGAGFDQIEIRTETIELVYPTEEDWWRFQLTMGSRAALYRLSEEQREQFKDEYLAQLRPLSRSDGLHLPAPALFALARNSASKAHS